MFKEKITNEKGISLLALVFSVIIMLIITNMLIYNAGNNHEKQMISDMYNDLEVLNDRILLYYSRHSEIPKLDKYNLNIPIEHINPNDNDVYYRVDISKLDNTRLNFGNEKNGTKDIYVVNESTLTVYYALGIKVNDKTYYRLQEKYNEIDESKLGENIANKDVYLTTSKNNYTDSFGKKATVPKGFFVSKKEDERSVDKGLVIKDENNNEYVWVPCKIDQFQKTNWETEVNFDTKYLEDVQSQEYKNMVSSINIYDGFYISRFESSYNSGTAIVDYKSLSKKSVSTSTAVWVNAYGRLWNQISNVTAKKVANNLYNSSDSVSSHLIYGTQWDIILKWIEESGMPITNIKDDSKNLGNYLNSEFGYNDKIKPKNTPVLVNTGIGDYSKINNIYDLAGNLSELTQEYLGSNVNTYIVRGGNFNTISTTENLSKRIQQDKNVVSSGVGFRVAIYIK